MPRDQAPRGGGAYAKLWGGHTTSREFTGDDGAARARMHGAAAPFRARVGGLDARPQQRGETPHVPRSPSTKAYEPWAWRMWITSAVTDAACKLGISEETIDGILDRGIERAVDWTAWEWLGVIGLDEIALKRGHRDFVGLVTAPLGGVGVEILAVLADREQETVA